MSPNADSVSPAAEMEALLREAADALWECSKAALTVKPCLDEPYRDDPRWTPWTRWVEHPSERAYELKHKITRYLASQIDGSAIQIDRSGEES